MKDRKEKLEIVHNRFADRVGIGKWDARAAATPEEYMEKKWGPGIKHDTSRYNFARSRSKSRYPFANQGAGKKKKRKTRRKKRKTRRKKRKTRRTRK
jgi:hypothetical protein